MSATSRTDGMFSSDGPLQIGSDKQLFIGPWAEDGRDEYLVESMRNVEMTMHEARVTGERLMEQETPWEGAGMLDMRQFVLKDEDLYRIYYSALPYHFVLEAAEPSELYGSLWEEPHQRIVCYAESRDGIQWDRPNLGLWEWDGSRDNNILFPNDGFDYVFSEMEGVCVFIDPAAKSPDEKYKMFAKITPVGTGGTEDRGPTPAGAAKALPKGQYPFASPDGIHWRLLSTERVSFQSNDTQYSVFWDERIGKYVQYTRVKRSNTRQVEYYKKHCDGYEGRMKDLSVGRAVSDDFIHWSDEEVVLGPDDVDQAGAPEGLVRMDFYGGNISKYPGAPNVYIGMPNAYYHWEFDMTRRSSRGRPIQLPSTMDVQLVTSRDGIHWHRTPGRRPFIRVGPEGTFWSKTIWPDGNVHRVGEELWIFFAGLDVSHKEQSIVKSNGARGRAVLRLDGLISADAAYTGGELVTRPLVFAGDCLRLNVDTGAGGTVRVELLDEQGKPVEGFAEADCDAINGNYIRWLVTWRGSPDVRSLAGRAVRLRFVMRDTRLFSFQFLPQAQAAGTD